MPRRMERLFIAAATIIDSKAGLDSSFYPLLKNPEVPNAVAFPTTPNFPALSSCNFVNIAPTNTA